MSGVDSSIGQAAQAAMSESDLRKFFDSLGKPVDYAGAVEGVADASNFGTDLAGATLNQLGNSGGPVTKTLKRKAIGAILEGLA